MDFLAINGGIGKEQSRKKNILVMKMIIFETVFYSGSP